MARDHRRLRFGPEVDLDLRGEGTIRGERQKGRKTSASLLRRDREWVEAAREGAPPAGRGGGGLATTRASREVTLFLGDDESGYLLKSDASRSWPRRLPD
ncbi:MAG: hypothetical protein Ct9H300mP31_14970 [Acidimicrobiaceae bacterium]|nr:MAG: hypothetical protein Ct9H300mP31_14970 [Acidimicrobiaceae bacterium]